MLRMLLAEQRYDHSIFHTAAELCQAREVGGHVLGGTFCRRLRTTAAATRIRAAADSIPSAVPSKPDSFMLAAESTLMHRQTRRIFISAFSADNPKSPGPRARPSIRMRCWFR